MNIHSRTEQMETITPVSLYRKLAGEKKFLLESKTARRGEGRYSYIGINPYMEAMSEDGKTIIIQNGERSFQNIGIIDYLKEQLGKEVPPALDVPFKAGAAGYMGYDIARQYEDIGGELPDPLEMPDAHFLFMTDYFIFDHKEGCIHLLTLSEEPGKRLSEMAAALNQPDQRPAVSGERLDFSPGSRSRFLQMTEKAKLAIQDGELFQIVLSQRFESEFEGDPFNIYCRLRRSNPSPYMYFIEFGPYTVLGSSPESLIRARGGNVTVNPIAGTRQRGESALEDQQLEEELLTDEKELAEHRMLVDLGRNDLGKVCRIGSVSLLSMMKVERYKHVMHITSQVSGILNPGVAPLDALASCLPAGTVSGAPKIRAMQLINEWEPFKRGVYSGAVGYISFGGDLDMALAIRTMVIKDGKAAVQAGAGIVYDSVPENEYEEIKHKARALTEVLNNDTADR